MALPKFNKEVGRNWGLRGPALFFVCLFYQLLNDVHKLHGNSPPQALVFPRSLCLLKNSIGIPRPRAPCLSQGPSAFPWASLSVLILESRELIYVFDLEELLVCHHQQKGRFCSLVL